jgi:hypothetical protein
MAYSLTKVEAGWEVQNGTEIKILVPDLKSIEKVLKMLSPVVEVERKTERETVMEMLGKSKKALTASEVIALINADQKECKNIHMILSVLGRKKILKRRKNSSGVYVYSAK